MSLSAEQAKVLDALDRARPVLIAGPTASGKSALAFAAAQLTGGPIVNADAIQVFADWRILTARPSVEDEARHLHALYGHVPGKAAYSVGHWLRDVEPFLSGPPPVIVGGTGLNFEVLTKGLAPIPETPTDIRRLADQRLREDGLDALAAELDAQTAADIDLRNPARVQRAWEVLRATGRGMADWQAETPAPLLDGARANRILLTMEPDRLTLRIEARLDQMLEQGAIGEARRNAGDWTPSQPSAKAIGAAELIAHVKGEMSLDEVKERIAILTRQYAKRQRTFFRGRLKDWTEVAV